MVPEYQTNENIQADELFVISETGEQIGAMSRSEALKLAKERELDLVVVSPKANPPVAKIIDHGQFKYQKEKEARKQKAQSKQTEIKAVRLSVRIGKHDLDVRMKRALEFLKRGDKVKVEIVLRGREKAHADRGRETIKDFVRELQEKHEIELAVDQELKQAGPRLTIIVGMK